MGLFEMNAAAEIIHGVAHQDANIIFGTDVDDEMGDEIKVTVIAAGFDRWDAGGPPAGGRPTLRPVENKPPSNLKDIFPDDGGVDPLDGGGDDDDDFDVPSFLK
jgi:cell division protein FtsZ